MWVDPLSTLSTHGKSLLSFVKMGGCGGLLHNSTAGRLLGGWRGLRLGSLRRMAKHKYMFFKNKIARLSSDQLHFTRQEKWDTEERETLLANKREANHNDVS